ncbi:MAG: molybdate ABC transporter substrate-binding protein [Ruminococcus sp.]|nr:molybdate ABC transporter substrate-binding protein [Ruminococcus sp.]
MKRFIALLLTVILIASLAGCSSAPADQKETFVTDPDPEGIELVIFAAASMTETLEEIAELYKVVDPYVTLTFNFDSSGTLKTQIEEGAVCDLFISAAQKQMNQLDVTQDEDKNPDKLDFIDSETRINLLENKVALCVPENNPKNINSYDDLATALEGDDILFAMGNEDVPVGQYTQKIFAYYQLDKAALAEKGVITYGSNVKEVTSQISEGAVDAGVIYQTDAYSANLTIVDTATEDMCGKVIYPAAVLKNSEYHEAAQAFLDFLTTEEASKVFEKVGFTPLS